MAWKVKNEMVNPKNGQRMQRGQFIDPDHVPDQDELDRLRKANAIVEAPDAEHEQWKRDEANRLQEAQAKRATAEKPLEQRVADLEKRMDELRPPAPATATMRPIAGQSTPEKERAQEEEIKRRAGQRPGDDNDQRKSK